MIGGEDDEGVFEFAFFAEVIEDGLKEGIETLDGTVVVGDVLSHGDGVGVTVGDLDGLGVDIGDSSVAVDSGFGIPQAVDTREAAEGEMWRADVIPEEEGFFG